MSAALVAVSTGLVALVALVVVVRLSHRERRTRARLTALVGRLEESAPGVQDAPATLGQPAPDLGSLLDRAERAVDRSLEGAQADAARRARVESALSVVPEGVVVVDEQGEVVFRNPVAEGFAEGRHGDALVGGAVDELVAEALASARAQERTLDLFGPPRRTVVVRATPLLGGARAVGVLAVVDDVTERRRLEAVRRDFVANISHELKTPVGALSLLAETLLAEDDAEVSHRLANRMLDEATRVAHTIDDLLELSRIEAEEAPEREPVPVHLIVAEAVTRIRPAAEHAGIAVRFDEPSRRLMVMGDRRQLVSAVYNLLDNAVKYSDPGGSVEVRTSTTDGREVRIAVVDHGIGIPARDLERVFERFYRVDAARSRRTGGTGLGLAIVRHVVANHAGEVEVSSRLGEGSTFTLRFPLAAGPVAVDDGAHLESEAG